MNCCSEYRDYFATPEIMIKAAERLDAYEEIFESPAAMPTFQVRVPESDVAAWHRIRESKLMTLKSKPFDLKVPYNEKDIAKSIGAK